VVRARERRPVCRARLAVGLVAARLPCTDFERSTQHQQQQYQQCRHQLLKIGSILDGILIGTGSFLVGVALIYLFSDAEMVIDGIMARLLVMGCIWTWEMPHHRNHEMLSNKLANSL
jgi:hypothetical protein